MKMTTELDPPWLLDWDAAFAAGPSIAGGKGWNLGRLHRYGFQVPDGGVLSARAYARFMADPQLVRLREDLKFVTADDAAAPESARRLEAMQAAIRSTPLPQEIASAVETFLRSRRLEDVPLAVRSSATAEDSAAASFAGIHTSRLGQVGLEGVLESIRECYASLWTPRAAAYRRRIGLSDDEVLCAVVLCRMVGAGGDPRKEPECAGVAFSCDPRSGRRDVVTIGAVRGLGEALVSGAATPEEIVVQVGWEPAVIERRRAGDPGSRGGQADQGRGSDRRDGVHQPGPGDVLSDELAIRLAYLVQRVHWALGDGHNPQDVEWAYDGSTFWLLQARPVTRLPRYTFPGAERLPVVWSNANLKDALPGVLTPLAWSMTVAVIRRNLFAAHSASGYEIPPGLEVCRRFSGRAYFDFTSLFWAYYDGLGLTAAEFNRSLGGHQPELPVDEPNPMKGKDARRRSRTRARLLRVLLKLDKTLPREIRAHHEAARRSRGTDLSRETLEGLRLRMLDLIAETEHFGPRSMLANTSAGVWHDGLEKLLAKVSPDNAHALASDLLAGSGNVVSAEHGYRLLDLAAAAARDAEARKLLAREPLEASAWKQLPACSPFRAELERFLADFGHRAVYEVEIANPRWVEDPRYILQQVRLLLESGVTEDFREAARQKRHEAERAVARRAPLLLPLVRWLARQARRGGALREGAKSALVALLEQCRYVVLEIGRRMHAAGVLDAHDDVFYLTAVELDAFTRGLWDGRGAKALVRDRKAQQEAWLSETPPDVIVEGGAPVAGGDALAAAAGKGEQHGRTLKGTGVAAGRATGRARILHHPSESDRLAKGEILVAPSTDPGWTPLFMRAAAIAVEVGGYHSHGAIVARELGIPAVANVPGLLAALQDGETITVDGDTGTILRH